MRERVSVGMRMAGPKAGALQWVHVPPGERASGKLGPRTDRRPGEERRASESGSEGEGRIRSDLIVEGTAAEDVPPTGRETNQGQPD